MQNIDPPTDRFKEYLRQLPVDLPEDHVVEIPGLIEVVQGGGVQACPLAIVSRLRPRTWTQPQIEREPYAMHRRHDENLEVS